MVVLVIILPSKQPVPISEQFPSPFLFGPKYFTVFRILSMLKTRPVPNKEMEKVTTTVAATKMNTIKRWAKRQTAFEEKKNTEKKNTRKSKSYNLEPTIIFSQISITLLSSRS